MAELNTILAVNLVTPRGVLAHTDADSVQAPGELGEFDRIGEVRFKAADRVDRRSELIALAHQFLGRLRVVP